MTAQPKAFKKDITSLPLFQKLSVEEPVAPSFKTLLSSQLQARLTDKENIALAAEITVSHFRHEGSLKSVFSSRERFINRYLLQLTHKTTFPAQTGDLSQFFQMVLHAQGQDAYTQRAKRQYKLARVELDNVLLTFNKTKEEATLTKAIDAEVALAMSFSSIKTAKAKLARAFNRIPKNFIHLILPLYRDFVKTNGAGLKAKSTFLNAISFALIERQISVLNLPKEARIKRITAFRAYLKNSNMLEKIWLALKQANLERPFNNNLNKATIKLGTSIYSECETFFKKKFLPYQERVGQSIALCKNLSALYANDPFHIGYLIQQTLNIQTQFLACEKMIGQSFVPLSQMKAKIEAAEKNLDEIILHLLQYTTSHYSRSFKQTLLDVAHLTKQNHWLDAARSLFISPLRTAKDLARIEKNEKLLHAITTQESLVDKRAYIEEVDNAIVAIEAFDHSHVIKTQFAQSQQKTLVDSQKTEQIKEAAVFAPKP